VRSRRYPRTLTSTRTTTTVTIAKATMVTP
jgi:hypothetical protein